MRQIYLAGGMERRKDNGKTWRRIITPKLLELGYEVFNPCLGESPIFEKYDVQPSSVSELKRNDPDTAKALFFDICERDIQAIKESQIMIVYYDESVNMSSGTTSEMTLAKHIFKMPVLVIRKIPRKDIPGWSTGCYDKFFDDIDDCVKYLKEIK